MTKRCVWFATWIIQYCHESLSDDVSAGVTVNVFHALHLVIDALRWTSYEKRCGSLLLRPMRVCGLLCGVHIPLLVAPSPLPPSHLLMSLYRACYSNSSASDTPLRLMDMHGTLRLVCPTVSATDAVQVLWSTLSVRATTQPWCSSSVLPPVLLLTAHLVVDPAVCPTTSARQWHCHFSRSWTDTCRLCSRRFGYGPSGS